MVTEWKVYLEPDAQPGLEYKSPFDEKFFNLLGFFLSSKTVNYSAAKNQPAAKD